MCLHQAIADRASTITWREDTFAYAEAHDGEGWVGLHTDDAVAPAPRGLLIHPDRVPEPEAPVARPGRPTTGPRRTAPHRRPARARGRVFQPSSTPSSTSTRFGASSS